MKVTADRCELLQGYRVLDLTDSQGYLCGRILGDLEISSGLSRLR